MTTRPTVPDADARALAQTALDANLLVEAGAGSGKTTLMVDRVLALLARGTPPDQIAAVTFTRKAATELRERLAKRLEERVARATGTAEESALRTAQRQIDRAYIGTIHSFCSRLLREEALAARLAPDFVEPDPALLAVAAEEFLRAFADDARRLGTHGADRLRTLGIEPRDLVTAALTIDAQPDVAFVAHDMPCPDVALVVAALDALMTRAVALLPAGAPSGGWDRLQTFVRRWQIERDALDWTDAATVARATARIESFHAKQVILSRWIPERKAQAPITALRDDVLRFVSGELAEFLRAWRAHCYSPALRLATAASAAWRAHREANDRLTFEDLLVRTAALLRTHAVARDALGDRWRHLLVDEFQDTDPLQAEICLLLASPASEGNDWRMVTPRPGALFVVGDPKQSIYRFRRADIQTYEFVRGRFERFGHVVQLIANFRSTDAIATLVNAHFAVAFGAAPHGVGTTSPSAPAATATQAPFAPLVTACPAPPGTGVGRYDVPTARAKAAVFDADAAMVASHIAESICAGVATPDDFLILTARKSELRAYAAALALRGVPAVTAGAAGEWSDEITALRQIVDALAAPDDRIAVVTALEGRCFGCTPADLFDAHEAGVTFVLDDVLPAVDLPAVSAMRTLQRWYHASSSTAPSVLLDRLLDETGLLPWSASQMLGDQRAGALLGLVESLRRVAAVGDDLSTLRAVLDAAIASEESDLALHPGSAGAVRVMNLHKAKGLEARIVFLAAPWQGRTYEPTVVIRRDPASGGAQGALSIAGNDGAVCAAPHDWADWVAEDARLRAEEDDRLLYVATTRAKESLWIATTAGKSPWGALDATLDALGVATTALPVHATDGRRASDATRASVEHAIAAAAARRARVVRGRELVEAVTAEAKRSIEREATAPADDVPLAPVSVARAIDPRDGRAWGIAVHGALEAAIRLPDARALHARLDAIIWHGWSGLTDAQRAALTAELRDVVDRVRASDGWRALTTASAVHAELPMAHVVVEPQGTRIREGVIDLALETTDGWHVIDWKSDRVPAATWAQRVIGYEAQVALYGEALTALTGREARGQVVQVDGQSESGFTADLAE